MAGQNDGTIENCSVTGSVASHVDGNDGNVGGITGENRGTTTGCAAACSVTVADGSCVGGIAGWHREGSITDCHSSATVTAMVYVGGIAGQSNATITACYSTGDVTATKNGDNSFVGGVVGYSTGAVLTACYATGSVSGEGDYVGGVVGSNENGTVTACYWNGTVTGDNGIGNDMVGNGKATKVEGSTVTWQDAVEGMNAALTGNDYKWVLGANSLPVLQRNQ